MFVGRRADRTIYGLWEVRQWEGQEELPFEHPDVQAFLHPAPTSEDIRKQEIDAAISADTTIVALKAMTDAEFDAWWTANVTTAAQAIAVLKRLARVVIRRL